MKTSADGQTVIKHFEQCRLVAYPDPKTGGAPWTCGWGTTGPDVVRGTVWTQAYADQRFAEGLEGFEDDATNAIRVPVPQGVFNAFVSILQNVGHGSPVRDGIIRLKSNYPSTLLRKLNDGDLPGAREQWAKWVSPGSNVEHGLRKRRRSEQALFDGLNAAQAIIIGEAMP